MVTISHMLVQISEPDTVTTTFFINYGYGLINELSVLQYSLHQTAGKVIGAARTRRNNYFNVLRRAPSRLSVYGTRTQHLNAREQQYR